MTNTPTPNPPISAVLDEFFSSYLVNADDETRRRIALVRQDLLSHMDEEGWRVLDAGETAVLESEEQFGRKGFFARAARASNLFCILEHYLQPVHAQVGIEQRSTQLAVVAALAEKLVRDRIATADSVARVCRLEFDLALRQGRSDVNAARVRERKLAS